MMPRLNNLPIDTAFLFLLMTVSQTLSAANSCVILQYHHVSESTPAITSVTPKQFADHLNYLKENDFAVLPLADVITQIKNDIELPDKCVSLTVDDAYDSIYTTAYPLIKKYDWPMTVFVNSQAVDKGRKPYMSWSQMRAMQADGFTFETHGHSHSHLIRLFPDESHDDWEQRVSSEILITQNRIIEELDYIPQFFAHSYGEYNPDINAILKGFNLVGFGQQSGPVWPDANFSALPRFPMASHYAALPGFITKVNSLPMPVTQSLPDDPLLPINMSQPELILQLAPGKWRQSSIQCFVNGSKNVAMQWLDEYTLTVKPNFDLPAGRSRTNCTMSSNQKGRFHWYSHNWIKRKNDGSWYLEY